MEYDIFDPTMCSTETGAVRDVHAGVSHFDPTRVHLKPPISFPGFVWTPLLRPHKGSSETRTVGVSNGTRLCLRPNKGSFETVIVGPPVQRRLPFDPIRVHLKRPCSSSQSPSRPCFDPTKGSSETRRLVRTPVLRVHPSTL